MKTNIFVYIISLVFVWTLNPIMGYGLITLLPFFELADILKKDNNINTIAFFFKRLLIHYLTFTVCAVLPVLLLPIILTISVGGGIVILSIVLTILLFTIFMK